MTKIAMPTLQNRNTGSIISSCAGIAASLFVSSAMWMIMR